MLNVSMFMENSARKNRVKNSRSMCVVYLSCADPENSPVSSKQPNPELPDKTKQSSKKR